MEAVVKTPCMKPSSPFARSLYKPYIMYLDHQSIKHEAHAPLILGIRPSFWGTPLVFGIKANMLGTLELSTWGPPTLKSYVTARRGKRLISA